MNIKANNATKSGTVFIVDDEENIRVSLGRFLKSYGYRTETFASATEFLNRPMPEGVACLILDLDMLNMSGLELQQQIADSYSHVPVVFLTAQGDIPASVKAMKLGAEDFLPKMSDEKELLDAVERALNRSKNKIEFDKSAALAMEFADSLTDRERMVCQCVISGMLNKQIAIKLDIAGRTVKAHRAKVMEKFGVCSLPDLVRLAE